MFSISKLCSGILFKKSLLYPFRFSSIKGYAWEDIDMTHLKKVYPDAINIDEYFSKVEIALYKYGFTPSNTIALTNICRDEITKNVQIKIEEIFGSSFSATGLGGVFVCGKTGLKALVSHSPIFGVERYAFFSLPHIAIDVDGTLGEISRQGRVKKTAACGSLVKCLKDFKEEGLEKNFKQPGVHTPNDVEYSILKQRLARFLGKRNVDVKTLNLKDLTDYAEELISQNLQTLIDEYISERKANYAIITGIQIHYCSNLQQNKLYETEFIQPKKFYINKDQSIINIDLNSIISLTPRQLKLI